MEKDLKAYVSIALTMLQKAPKIIAGKVMSITLESYLDVIIIMSEKHSFM